MIGSGKTGYVSTVVSKSQDKKSPDSIGDMLDRFERLADDEDEVSVDGLLEEVGRRSFGPLLLLGGIILSAPGVSDIPSVPTIVGLFILLVSVQILFGREEIWLPRWLLRRTVSGKRLKRMVSSKWIRKPAGWVDRFVTRRLKFLAGPRMSLVVAAATTLLAVISPVTEVVPLSSMGVGAAIVAFGISLVARDGLMTLIGLLISAGTLALALAVI